MEDFIVDTDSGRLRGTIEQSVEGYNYCAFKGIPYAKPPVGELRFQDPLPVEPWPDIRDAKVFGPMCTQWDIVTQEIQGSDDCLYLNIYVKSIEPKHHQPVMVWIHGGCFMFGCGDDTFYGPDYFLKKDIVLITINYRLGVFGFLNLEDEVAPGNQGLKDQVMALEWIQRNIKNFGGDPDNVTIFGESAGGASVHFLSLSNLTKGLFHKAIAQSGVALNTWAMVSQPKGYAYQLCALLGKETYDSKTIVEFLRTVDSKVLVEAQTKLQTPQENLRSVFPFGPGIDNKSMRPFMPLNIAAEESVHVPFLLGYNDREGICFLTELSKEIFNEMNCDLEKYLHPRFLDVLKEYNLTAEDLKRLYYGSESITKSNSDRFVNLWGDMHIIEGIHSVVKNQVERGSAPTYLYQFTYDKGYSFAKPMISIPMKGVSHFDEVPFIFSMRFFENLKIDPLKNAVAHKIMEQMVELWVNFARTGRPTPVISDLVPVYWQPVVNGTILRYLNIGEELRMEKTLNIEERYSYKNIRKK